MSTDPNDEVVEIPEQPELAELSPGVFTDLDEASYHRGLCVDGEESISASGLKTLLGRSPAHYRWERDNPRPPKAAFDLGHAAHSIVLGVGAPIVHVEFDSWRTNAAKGQAAEARRVGAVPLLTRDFEPLREMVRALWRSPAAAWLRQEGGHSEVSVIVRDPESGVMLRSRYDRLSPDQTTIIDFKTSEQSCSPEAFGRRLFDFGYDLQNATYLHAGSLAGLPVERFVFVAQEVKPPYAVSVVELDTEAVESAAREMRRGLNLFAECAKSGEWPGYPTAPVRVGLPGWIARKRDTANGGGDVLSPELETELMNLINNNGGTNG